ncbi:oligosaccharyl transferase subunit ost3/OST6 [Tulasnella sp. 419]|nr:oligosaccharyl transferase subunit ost3/OST6 [Tulasnella sp. 419]
MLGSFFKTIPFLLATYLVSAQIPTTRTQFAQLAASAPNGIIKLNNQLFDAITSAERDWSVSVTLTAMAPNFKCKPCHEFAPSFDAVARSWKKVSKKNRDYHFFAVLDFADGQEVFRRMGLNTAPFSFFYPAKQGPLLETHPKTDTWSFDFNTRQFDPASFSKELSPHTPVPIPYSPPPPYELYFTMAVVAVTTFICYQFFWNQIMSVFGSRWTWGVMSLALIVTMISGHMFTKIRASPYAQMGRGNVVHYIAPGYQNQYGAETQIVGGLYTVLALSQIALTLFVPRLPSASRQRAAVYIWVLVSCMIYSVLLAVFKLKNGGYPFRLFI